MAKKTGAMSGDFLFFPDPSFYRALLAELPRLNAVGFDFRAPKTDHIAETREEIEQVAERISTKLFHIARFLTYPGLIHDGWTKDSKEQTQNQHHYLTLLVWWRAFSDLADKKEEHSELVTAIYQKFDKKISSAAKAGSDKELLKVIGQKTVHMDASQLLHTFAAIEKMECEGHLGLKRSARMPPPSGQPPKGQDPGREP